MLSTIAAELASELTDRSKYAAFFDLLEALQGTETTIKKLLSAPDQRANVVQQLTAAAKSQRPWAVQAAASAYRIKLAYLPSNAEHSEDVSTLTQDVDAFLVNLENYLVKQSEERLFHLAWHAIFLADRLDGFLIALRLMVEALGVPQLDAENVLVIRLAGPVDLEHLKQSISAVQKMYVVVADLLEISAEDEPLELIKVETGSLELIVKGSKAAVLALGKFLSGFAAYVSISKRVADTNVMADSLFAQVGLRDQLVAQGVDVTEIDEQIAGAATALARHTHKLIGNAESVGVNGTFVDLTSDFAKLLPLERKLLGPPKGE